MNERCRGRISGRFNFYRHQKFDGFDLDLDVHNPAFNLDIPAAEPYNLGPKAIYVKFALKNHGLKRQVVFVAPTDRKSMVPSGDRKERANIDLCVRRRKQETKADETKAFEDGSSGSSKLREETRGSEARARTARELTLEFAARTTMHGVGRVIGSSPALWERLLWACLVVGMSIWAFYSVVSNIQTYLSYPVSTVVSQDFDPPLEFPGITFCNMNRMRKSGMSNYTYSVINHVNFTPATVKNLIDVLNRSTTATRATLTRLMNGMLDGMENSELLAAGHSLEDMLVGCVFNSKACGVENFTTFFSPIYGNCYTFGEEGLKVSHGGKLKGIILDLNAQIEEYTPLATSLGIQISLHQHKEMPFPEKDGITATTGQVTSIGLKQRKVRSLPHPYSDCSEGSLNPKLNLYSRDGHQYSREACARSNFQKEMIKSCKCCAKWYPCDESLLGSEKSASNLGEGNSSSLDCSVPGLAENVEDRATQACFFTILSRIGHLELFRGCPPACSQTLYFTSISSSRLSRKDLLAYERQFHPDQPRADYLQRAPSIVRVEIYFQDLSTEYTVSVPAFDGNKLLGDIGGQLGLLLGFSLLTAVELLELVARLCAAAAVRLSKWAMRGKVGSGQEGRGDRGQVEVKD